MIEIEKRAPFLKDLRDMSCSSCEFVKTEYVGMGHFSYYCSHHLVMLSHFDTGFGYTCDSFKPKEKNEITS